MSGWTNTIQVKTLYYDTQVNNDKYLKRGDKYSKKSIKREKHDRNSSKP